jgi:hypothetical protein
MKTYHFSALACFALCFGLSSVSARAEDAPARGLVTSAACPYSCRDAGLPKESCRERRRGSVCEVEDLTQAPGHRTMMRLPGAASRQKAEPRGQLRTWRDTNGTWAAIPASMSGAAPQPGQRGLITSANCPYSCKQAGLSPEVCRERRSGNVCEVEDLTQAPGHRTLFRMPRQ